MPVPFLWCGGSWLGCAVVPVMGALFQSRGWLPIVEAPGYFRHPTSILAMQLLNAVKCNLTELTTKSACVSLEVSGVDTYAHVSEFHVLVDCSIA